MEDLKKFIKLLAEESAEIIKRYYRSDFNVEFKSDLSPVTIADKNAEQKMREMIMKEYPEHGIIGEEFGLHNESADYRWVLDPIDGTKSFISGVPLFGTLIALLYDGKPILGAINLPVLSQFIIGDNNSTELNGNKVAVRECSNLADSVLLSTDHLHIEQYQDISKFNKLIHKVKLYRNWGDCYGYYLVATGYADIMIDPVMNIWDSMAVIPVIKGAGGIITDYNGKDASSGNSIIAAGKILHPEVLNILNN